MMKADVNGSLEVFRESLPFAKLRVYSVFVDGVKAGSIKDGATLTLSLPEGVHEVWCKIDWKKSNKAVIQIEQGKTSKITVGLGKKHGWKYFMLTGTYLCLFLVGATFGMPLLIGLAAGGMVMARMGNLYLYQRDRALPDAGGPAP